MGLGSAPILVLLLSPPSLLMLLSSPSSCVTIWSTASLNRLSSHSLNSSSVIFWKYVVPDSQAWYSTRTSLHEPTSLGLQSFGRGQFLMTTPHFAVTLLSKF